MIVLRIHFHGTRRDVRLEKPHVVLGSDPQSDVAQDDVGWAAQEVELIHRGTEVELRRIHRSGDLRLRVGDEVRIGHARLTLVGLLPLTKPAAEASVASEGEARQLDLEPEPEPEPAPEPDAPATGPTFGGYDEDLPRADEVAGPDEENPFELVDELRPREAPEPTKPAPPPARPPARPPAPPTRASPPPPREAAPPPPPTEKAASATTTKKGKLPLPRPPTPAFRQASFGEELVKQLKRAPFFFLSVGLHVLVFLILSLLQTGREDGGPDGTDGTLHAALTDPAVYQSVGDEEEEPEDPIPDLPELPEPLPLDEDLAIPEPPMDGDSLEELPTDEPAPLLVGLNPSLSSVAAGTGRKKQLLSPAELKQTFSKREATTTNEKAADYVRGELARGTGRQGHLLETISRNDLLVVDGTFDKIGRVLHALRLPYVRVPPREIAKKSAPDLAQHKVIFWNCGESLPDEQLLVVGRKLKTFVKNGGYLFTTDWAVRNVLAHAFPGYLRTNGARSPLPETVVEIQPARGQQGHRLLDGVFPRGAKGQWWLEQASFDVVVKRPRDVTVLISSEDLAKLYRKSPVVAATFPFGRGQVLHVVGHYYQEMGNLAGAISAQRLALNFVLMRLEKD